jgi:hypothetical protein
MLSDVFNHFNVCILRTQLHICDISNNFCLFFVEYLHENGPEKGSAFVRKYAYMLWVTFLIARNMNNFKWTHKHNNNNNNRN